MQKYLGVAGDNEALNEDEILTAVNIAMTVSAGRTYIKFMKSLEIDDGDTEEPGDDCYPDCCEEEQDK